MREDLLVLQKARLGKLELRNRLVVPPMEMFLADENGHITDAYIKYVEARAQGGFGLFILEATYVDPLGKGFKLGVGIDADDKIPGLRKLVGAVHANGGKIAVQLHHAGRETSSAITGATIVAPSVCPVCYSNEPVHELTQAEIRQIVKKFAEGAMRAKAAGFDAVMIHGAHGYLLTQFLSPYTNKRNDEYGGSLENRLRISFEVIEAIRKEVGKDFPVSYRLTVEEGLPGSLTLQEGCAAATLLSKTAIDCLHITAGNYGSNQLVIPPYFRGHLANKNRLQAVRNAVGPDFPLSVAGRITDVFEAEELVRDGLAQFVAMGRASLADPELPKRSAAGAFSSVRTCIGCNDGCVGRTKRGLSASCAVNPLTGHESEYPAGKAAVAKKILVIGAGPAGMEAAWLAARRGHNVILCEKEAQIGGQFLLAAWPPKKNDIFTYLTHMKNRLIEEKVDLRLNCEGNGELLESEKPDYVFLATGGKPLLIPFPGIDSIHSVSAQSVLKNELGALGQKVAVIGGGMVGLETAEFIAATGRKVEVIEMLPEVAPDLFFTVRADLLARLADYCVAIHTGHRVKSIKDGRLICETSDGVVRELGPFDSLVLALGVKPDKSLEQTISEKNIPYSKIGDCDAQGNCFHATHMALAAAEV